MNTLASQQAAVAPRDDNQQRAPARQPGTSEPAWSDLPPAYVYQPAPSATQGGPAHAREWVIEFAPWDGRDIEPLMGWTSSSDPFASIPRLRFPDRDSATTFAERHGWPYLVREPPRRRLRPKSYADNFRYDIAGAVARASREWDGALSLSDRRKQERDTSTADPAAILPHLDAPARSAEVANRV
jgi:hypothetical protein